MYIAGAEIDGNMSFKLGNSDLVRYSSCGRLIKLF